MTREEQDEYNRKKPEERAEKRRKDREEVQKMTEEIEQLEGNVEKEKGLQHSKLLLGNCRFSAADLGELGRRLFEGENGVSREDLARKEEEMLAGAPRMRASVCARLDRRSVADLVPALPPQPSWALKLSLNRRTVAGSIALKMEASGKFYLMLYGYQMIGREYCSFLPLELTGRGGAGAAAGGNASAFAGGPPRGELRWEFEYTYGNYAYREELPGSAPSQMKVIPECRFLGGRRVASPAAPEPFEAPRDKTSPMLPGLYPMFQGLYRRA